MSSLRRVLLGLVAIVVVVIGTAGTAAHAAPDSTTTTTTSTTIPDADPDHDHDEDGESVDPTTNTTLVPYLNGVPVGCPTSGVPGPPPPGVLCPTTVAVDSNDDAAAVVNPDQGWRLLSGASDQPANEAPTLYERTRGRTWSWTTDYGVGDAALLPGNGVAQSIWSTTQFVTEFGLMVYSWTLTFNPADVLSADWAQRTARSFLPLMWSMLGLGSALIGMRALLHVRRGDSAGGFTLILKGVLVVAATTLVALNPAQLYDSAETTGDELLATIVQADADTNDGDHYGAFPNMRPSFNPADQADTARRDTVDRLHHATIRAPWAIGQFGSWDNLITNQSLADVLDDDQAAAAQEAGLNLASPASFGELYIVFGGDTTADLFKDVYGDDRDWVNGKRTEDRRLIANTSLAMSLGVSLLLMLCALGVIGAYIGSLILIAGSGVAGGVALIHNRGFIFWTRWLSMLVWQLAKRFVFLIIIRLVVGLLAAILMEASPGYGNGLAAGGGMVIATVMVWITLIVVIVMRKQFITMIGQLAVPNLTPSSGNGAMTAALGGFALSRSGGGMLGKVAGGDAASPIASAPGVGGASGLASRLHPALAVAAVGTAAVSSVRDRTSQAMQPLFIDGQNVAPPNQNFAIGALAAAAGQRRPGVDAAAQSNPTPQAPPMPAPAPTMPDTPQLGSGAAPGGAIGPGAAGSLGSGPAQPWPTPAAPTPPVALPPATPGQLTSPNRPRPDASQLAPPAPTPAPYETPTPNRPRPAPELLTPVTRPGASRSTPTDPSSVSQPSRRPSGDVGSSAGIRRRTPSMPKPVVVIDLADSSIHRVTGPSK